jgi:two-component system CheB/CheR fusion protein
MLKTQGKYAGKSILIVEDDNISRALFKEMLKNTGITLHFVQTGKETLEFFENNPVPNLVFMDIRLPDINGLEVSKLLFKKYPSVTIVAQTAFANQNWEENCLKAGMKAFITKPISSNDLERVLDDQDW